MKWPLSPLSGRGYGILTSLKMPWHSLLLSFEESPWEFAHPLWIDVLPNYDSTKVILVGWATKRNIAWVSAFPLEEKKEGRKEGKLLLVKFGILGPGTQRESPQASTHQANHSSVECVNWTWDAKKNDSFSCLKDFSLANPSGGQDRQGNQIESLCDKCLNRRVSVRQTGRWCDGNRGDVWEVSHTKNTWAGDSKMKDTFSRWARKPQC